MAKSKSTTTRTKSTAANRRRKELREEKSLEAYGKGCSSGHNLAMSWLVDRQWTLPAAYIPGLQHVALEFMDAHRKARGARRSFVKGQVVGFFSTLEKPEQSVQLELWRQQNGGAS